MNHWWADGHLDLAYLAARGRDLRSRCATPGECVSIPDLLDGGVRVALATIYLDPDKPGTEWGYGGFEDVDGAENAALRQIEIYESLEEGGYLKIMRTRGDIDSLEDRLNIIVLMEGADPIRTPRHAQQWFDRGVRLVGLTWAAGTRYAGGNSKPGPLTSVGRELVHALDALSIVHDLSHLADEAARELLSISDGRVVATHSNARSVVTESERHIPDDLIRAVALRRGIIGLNLFSRFLTSERRATIEDAVRNVAHIATVMGDRSGVALGSDADGGFGSDQLPIDLDHPIKWRALQDALSRLGWSDDDVCGFAHDNWVRFLRKALPE